MKAKGIASAFLAILLLLVVFVPLNSKASENQARSPEAAYARGLIKVGQEDVVVEILAEVRPGEDPQASAKAALRRAYPDARPIDSSEYSLTGLVWDEFGDSDPGNDQVSVNYNPSGVSKYISNLDHRGTWLTSISTWTDVPSSK